MIQELVENIIRQADFFLKENGEFYPFASVMDKKGELKPLGILLENDKPRPEEVIKELTHVLRSGLEKEEYAGFALGINISLGSPHTVNDMGNPTNRVQDHKTQTINPEKLETRDAIEIRISTPSLLEKVIYLPYLLNPKTHEIQFGEFMNA